MGRRILRHEIEVGAGPKTFELTHSPVHVAAKRLDLASLHPRYLVEFWVEHWDGPKWGGPEEWTPLKRTLEVFGTNHEIPERAIYCGTTERTPEGLVWHLYELAEGS